MMCIERTLRGWCWTAGWMLAGMLGGAACGNGSSTEADGEDEPSGQSRGTSTGVSTPGTTSGAGTSGEGTGEDTWCTDESCQDMVKVPAGPFMMGCVQNYLVTCGSSEQPVHEVTLSAYAIDKYEVTREKYQACVEARVCEVPMCEIDLDLDGDPEIPMYCARWEDAATYCEWAGKRLPTEAEWEKAARGTDGRLMPWGHEPVTCERAVVNEEEEGCNTGAVWPVGSKPLGASPYGLLDMIGNVQEWVSDWYAEDYYARSPAQDPTGPETGEYHSIRGGSYSHIIKDLSAVFRGQGGIYGSTTGFRCVKPLE